MNSRPNVATWHNVDIDLLKNEIVPLGQPAILKNVISDWPIVEKAKQSNQALQKYLRDHSANKSVTLIKSEGQKGRLFYNQDLTGVNFSTQPSNMNDAVDLVAANKLINDDNMFYISNSSVKQQFPNLLENNFNDFLVKDAQPGIWISNKVKVAAHFDVPDNIACCIAGKRRFTLFPPEQIENLYIGPFDITPAGQPISLVNTDDPDFETYPKFKEAWNNAVQAELEPGDALYIPSLWWHQVESLSDLNVLMTYFHDATPRHYGSAFDCLVHGLMSVRQLPEHKKKAWKSFFEYYLFSDNAEQHIPENRRGILGQHTPQMSTNLRKMVAQNLTR